MSSVGLSLLSTPAPQQYLERIPLTSMPEERTPQQLEEIIQKATALYEKILKDKQRSERINRSYEYYTTLPPVWNKDVEAGSFISPTYLEEINALIEEKQSYETQQKDLLSNFSRFDSVHQVTFSADNSQLLAFHNVMQKISRELESYNNLPSLKSRFFGALRFVQPSNVVTPNVVPNVQPNNVVPTKIKADMCCVIS